MNSWQTHPVPAMRRVAVFGDRIVPCFHPRPHGFFAMFAASAERHAAREAIVFQGQRWTFAETARQAARIADGLASRGLQAGDRVGLLIDNRPEFVFVLLALQRLGAIAVPIGVREQRPGVAYMLAQCGAVGIVFDADLAARVPAAAETPTLRLRVSIGALGAAADGVAAYAPVEAAEGSVTLADLAVPGQGSSPPADVREQDAAVILYTSGTTGNPKGAVLTHLNIVHSVLHYQACMGLVADDRSALAVPASHVTGLIATIASMLHVGGAIVILPAFKAASFVELMAHERVTHTLMVPAMYNLCLRVAGFGEQDLSHWRIGGYGGAPMPVATIDALARLLPGLTLANAYGATETTSPATMMPTGETRAHADTVGIPVPCAVLAVMDDDGQELPPGETGELWIAGPMVVPRYWDNPAATAAGFTAGYWHSGDIGSIDADGYVRILDRKKDMLNRGGFKVYSVEVENVLTAWPGVVEAAVVGRPCPVLGERVHAVVYAPGIDPADEALRRHCAERLADYKVPESITWSTDPLPRNANGKLMKRSMRAP